MYQLSDVESTDSEDGIRFKTESTRSKNKPVARETNRDRRNDSPERRRYDRRRRRSRTPEKKHRRPRTKSLERSRKEQKQKSSKHKTHSDSDKHKRESPEKELIKPDLSKTASPEPILGPALPSRLKTNKEETDERIVVGPALPPHLIKKIESKIEQKTKPTIIGPILPVSNETKSESSPNKNSPSPPPPPSIGPILPPEFRNIIEQNTIQTDPIDSVEEIETDEDVYGPLPPNLIGNSKAHIALEERALKIKIDQLNPIPDKESREEWMLELPEVQSAKLGLGPRQFRAKVGPDLSDRSSWTDTPESKARKLAGDVVAVPDVKREAEIAEIKERDREQEKLIKKHKKKRKDKSLLELHRDKLKKKKSKEEEEGTSTRRPFDRDVDLKVNQFDEAQKKSILKRAQLLDDKFSSGQSKFL